MVSFRVENVDEPDGDLELFLEKCLVDPKVRFGIGIGVDIVGMTPSRVIEQE